MAGRLAARLAVRNSRDRALSETSGESDRSRRRSFQRRGRACGRRRARQAARCSSLPPTEQRHQRRRAGAGGCGAQIDVAVDLGGLRSGRACRRARRHVCENSSSGSRIRVRGRHQVMNKDMALALVQARPRGGMPVEESPAAMRSFREVHARIVEGVVIGMDVGRIQRTKSALRIHHDVACHGRRAKSR